jgi:hypothetical protein
MDAFEHVVWYEGFRDRHHANCGADYMLASTAHTESTSTTTLECPICREITHSTIANATVAAVLRLLDPEKAS